MRPSSGEGVEGNLNELWQQAEAAAHRQVPGPPTTIPSTTIGSGAVAITSFLTV